MAIFVSHKVSKIVNLLSPAVFFHPQNTLKFVFGRGSAPDPAGGAYDATPNPLVGWGGGHPLPIPLPLDAFGISILGALVIDAFSVSIRAKPAAAPLALLF